MLLGELGSLLGAGITAGCSSGELGSPLGAFLGSWDVLGQQCHWPFLLQHLSSSPVNRLQDFTCRQVPRESPPDLQPGKMLSSKYAVTNLRTALAGALGEPRVAAALAGNQQHVPQPGQRPVPCVGPRRRRWQSRAHPGRAAGHEGHWKGAGSLRKKRNAPHRTGSQQARRSAAHPA